VICWRRYRWWTGKNYKEKVPAFSGDGLKHYRKETLKAPSQWTLLRNFSTIPLALSVNKHKFHTASSILVKDVVIKVIRPNRKTHSARILVCFITLAHLVANIEWWRPTLKTVEVVNRLRIHHTGWTGSRRKKAGKLRGCYNVISWIHDLLYVPQV